MRIALNETAPATNRVGLSIIEVLIALSIIGILLALILPAVQSSREAARQTQCASNLRQIVVGIHNYSDSFGAIPPDGGHTAISFHVRLLPFTEQDSLYALIDFDNDISNQPVVSGQRPEYLSCPSDPVPSTFPQANSYSGNAGWTEPGGASSNVVPGTETTATGVVVPIGFGAVRLDDVADGLSSTAIVSESLPSDRSDIHRVVWQETPSSFPTYHRTPEAIAKDCLSASQWMHMSRGDLWTRGGYGATLYEHALPPNSRNCVWTFPASSVHAGDGVNTAFCDGRVQFVSSAIDSSVWLGLGTRNGSEIISNE